MSEARQKMENGLSLGCVDGVEVGVQPTFDSQDILIAHSDVGQRLACLLAFGKTEIVRPGGVLYWRVPHDREVDRLLVELTDLFISIRYAHPTLVQLELILSEAEGLQLDEPAP
jgi:hypothetical protein